MVKVGDIIYVGDSYYIGHGKDDFTGGKATVTKVFKSTSGGRKVIFITIKEKPDSCLNWEEFLSKEQKSLKAKFGNTWSHADPDYRPEFNED